MLKDLLNILSNYQQIEVIELINSLKRGLYSEKQIYYGKVGDCKETINTNREVIIIDALENEDIVIWVKEVEEIIPSKIRSDRL